MTMTEQQSIQWQGDSVETYIASLKASLGDSVNQAAIDAMELLYRAGWDDCYRLAKLNGATNQSSNCHNAMHHISNDYKGICADCGEEIW